LPEGVPFDLYDQVPEAYFIMTEDIEEVTHPSHDVEYGIDLVPFSQSIDETRAVTPATYAHDAMK